MANHFCRASTATLTRRAKIRREIVELPTHHHGMNWTQPAERCICRDIAIPSALIPPTPSREDVMNVAIAKPKLGKDSKAFLAKKHHMLIDGICECV
jgi:hypothetical protein